MAPQVLNIRLSSEMAIELEQVRAWLSKQIPGATRTDAAKMLLQKGLENLSSDKAWMNADLSRLGEFEPYDFAGQDPMCLGTPIDV